MATTSTIATARAGVVSSLDAVAELAGKVHYSWPGPEVAKNSHELVWIDRVLDWSHEIPNIKAGRVQRQEAYTFELVIWVAKPELTSDGAQVTFERAVALFAEVENVFADDVQIGLVSLQWLEKQDIETDMIPLEKGWGCQIMPQIRGHARLT